MMWKSTLTRIFPRGTAAFHKSFPFLERARLPQEDQANFALQKHDKDLLLNQIKHADTPSSFFHITSLHRPVMNNVHIDASFRTLFNIVRTHPGMQSEIAQHPEFKNLCDSTYKKVRYLKNAEIISILKTLNYLGIPSQTSLYQALCQMLKSNINDLNLSQVLFLFTVLRNAESSPIVDAIKIALPIVLQTLIEYQLDIDNPNQVAICFGIASEHNLNPETIKRLAFEVNKNVSCLTLHQALSCLKGASLYSLKYPNLSIIKTLIEPLCSLIAEHSSELTKPQIMLILSSFRRLGIFPQNLLDILYHRVTCNFDGKLLLPLLSCLMRKGSLSEDRLEKISTLTLENKYDIKANPSLYGFLLEIFVETDYLNSPELKEFLLGYSEFLDKVQLSDLQTHHLSPLVYLRRLKSLAYLSSLKTELLQRPFSMEFIESLLHTSLDEIKAKQLNELLQLYWLVKTTDNNGTYLSSDKLLKIVESFKEFNQHSEVDLSPHLSLALGGQEFFCQNIFSPLGHPINYLIVMREGQFPLPLHSSSRDTNDALNKSFSPLFDENVIPDQAKKIAIILDRKSDYIGECHIPKSRLRIKLQTLEKIGYFPLLINSEAYSELLDNEKIPYLMKEITQIFEKSYNGSLDSSEIPM